MQQEHGTETAEMMPRICSALWSLHPLLSGTIRRVLTLPSGHHLTSSALHVTSGNDGGLTVANAKISDFGCFRTVYPYGSTTAGAHCGDHRVTALGFPAVFFLPKNTSDPDNTFFSRTYLLRPTRIMKRAPAIIKQSRKFKEPGLWISWFFLSLFPHFLCQFGLSSPKFQGSNYSICPLNRFPLLPSRSTSQEPPLRFSHNRQNPLHSRPFICAYILCSATAQNELHGKYALGFGFLYCVRWRRQA
ncbi:hypothetical protein L218DRAFT_959936 [Marasmius fiardii PR-910]|nr:hypothetical protein L218DRAFT_959936 [Marasmius fiardii PR-910]